MDLTEYINGTKDTWNYFPIETHQNMNYRLQIDNAIKGITGEILLQLCESRLDNVVYRMGISPSRRGARQLVSHRHITVNGEIVNIPSYTLKAGDVVAVREKSKSLTAIVSSVSNNSSIYEWLNWNTDTMQGTFISVPERIQIPENINEQFIVELYSK